MRESHTSSNELSYLASPTAKAKSRGPTAPTQRAPLTESLALQVVEPPHSTCLPGAEVSGPWPESVMVSGGLWLCWWTALSLRTMGCQGLREGVRLWQAEVGLRAKGCQNAAVPELRHDGCRQQKKRHEDSRKRSGRDERGHDDRRWLLKEYAEDDRRLQEGRDHGKTFEIKTAV